MSFSCIKTTQSGQFESLHVHGQPVTDLWDEIQSVLKTYAQLFPRAYHIFLAQPFKNPSLNTTDWYGPECSPVPAAEQDQAKKTYTETRNNILTWARQNKGRTVDPEIAELLPTALTVPDINNIYRNGQNLILTTWGHRLITDMLGKGNLEGRAVHPSSPQAEQPNPNKKSSQPASTNEQPHPQNTQNFTNARTTSQTNRTTSQTNTSTQERVIIIPWYRRWYSWWCGLFPRWYGFPVFTFGLPLLLLCLAIGTPLGLLFWGVSAGWAFLASLLIGFGLWSRRFWGWGLIIIGILLLLWLLYSLCTGLFPTRHFSSLPGFANVEGAYPANGTSCSPDVGLAGPSHHMRGPSMSAPALPARSAASTTPIDPSHRRNAMTDLQNARNRGGNKGALEIALAWDDPSDLDLHVQPPQGKEIGYSSRASDGGKLDVDANVGTPTSPIVPHPIEHITWPSRPQPGTYRITVIPYSMRSDNKPVPYHVTVYENGQPIQEYSSSAQSSADAHSFDFNLPDTGPTPASEDSEPSAPSPAQGPSDAQPDTKPDSQPIEQPATQPTPDAGQAAPIQPPPS